MTKKLLLATACYLITALSIAQTTTTLTLQPDAAAGKDAEIFSCAPCGYTTLNFGTKRDLNAIAWTNGGKQSNVRSLIQFDLSGIPANATVTDAKLNLYFNPTSEEGKHAQIFGSNKSYLQRITSSWTESTVTWNTQPSVTTLNQVSLAGTTSSTQSFSNINVTQLIVDSRNNPASSFGFMLKLQQEKSYRKLIFASSDNATASIRPKLVITYTTPSPLVVNGNGFSNDELQIVPNPSKGETKLLLNVNEKTLAQVSVYDATGISKIGFLSSLTKGFNEIKFDAAALNRGVYFVSITTADKSYNCKLVIE